MPPRAARAQGGDRRRDPTVPGSTKTYSAQEFNKFYGPDRGPQMWKRAGQSGGAPPPLRPVRGAPASRGAAPKQQGKGKLQLGTKVKATGRLLGDQGQVVKKGAVGKVTALPGPKVRLERGAIAEVRIGGVTFDATRDMIELVQDAGRQQAPVKPRLAPAPPPRSRGPRSAPAQRQPAVDRRHDPTVKPNEKGANKTYTREQFNQFYGKELAAKMWKKAGSKAVKVAPKKAQQQGPEKRPDPTVPKGSKGAGKTYTRDQFNQFYGKDQGAKVWQKAGKLAGKQQKKAPAAPAGPEKRQDPTVQKGEKGFGKTYTKEQFTKFYGAKDAKALWTKAGKLSAKTGKQPAKQLKAKKDTAERRQDPTVAKGQKGFGKTYTKEQFVQFYGDKAAAKLWKKATPEKKPTVDKRPDPTMKQDQKGSKKTYTKEEFVAFYGKDAANKLWKEAAKLVPKKDAKDGKKKADKKDKKGDKKKKEEKPKKEKKVRDPPQLEELTLTIKRTEGQSIGWERNPRNQGIVAVTQESPASAAGLEARMRIHKIAGKDVKTDDDVKEALKAAGGEFQVVVTRVVKKEKETKKE
eukprot:Hpha_TRINITY_DN12794_c0_g2::TRINITY_DN12794_c0_g2_i1::g.114448::m.114448